MDFSAPESYKPATLFREWKVWSSAEQQKLKMDKDFLIQIENVDELLSDAFEKLDDETLICECFCVNVRDIRELCQTHVDLDLLQDQFGMGQGCTSCLQRKESWINKIF